MTIRPSAENPNLLNLFSRVECSKSSHSSASGSAKTVAAFRASQANTIYVHTIIIMTMSSVLRSWQWLGPDCAAPPWKLLTFDWLTSILTGSIKILTRAGSTAHAKKAGCIRARE